jgi:uncharacterized protein
MDFPEAVQKIADVLQPQKIILFGSRARGDFGVDSDYDLLIVVDDSITENTLRLAGRAHNAVGDRNFSLDVVVYRRSDFELSLIDQSDVVCHAMTDGQVIYERQEPQMAA